MKLPKAIIFDWDNTLVDSWPLIHFAMNETLHEMGMEIWSLAESKQKMHRSGREMFPDIFGKNWKKAAEFYKNSYRAHHLDKMEFFPGAVELVDFLFQQEIPLFVVSNKTGEALRLEAENLKIANKFQEIIGAGDAKFDKPHPHPVNLALKYSDLDPKKDLIWFIGDSIVDVECAINSHCQPIFVGDVNEIHRDLIEEELKLQGKEFLCFKGVAALLEELKVKF